MTKDFMENHRFFHPCSSDRQFHPGFIGKGKRQKMNGCFSWTLQILMIFLCASLGRFFNFVSISGWIIVRDEVFFGQVATFFGKGKI